MKGIDFGVMEKEGEFSILRSARGKLMALKNKLLPNQITLSGAEKHWKSIVWLHELDDSIRARI